MKDTKDKITSLKVKLKPPSGGSPENVIKGLSYKPKRSEKTMSDLRSKA